MTKPTNPPKRFSGYTKTIAEAVPGLTQAQYDEIEQCMRHYIFHSTLDWQTREQLHEAARTAAAVLRFKAPAIDQPTDPKTQKVRILWGSVREPDQQPSEYEFATPAEMNAFLQGVDEAVGWMGHEQIDPNPDGSWPEPEPDPDDEEEEE